MASIVEGQQYALTSQFSNHKGQSMVFVKLTDSALKAIEDYAAAVSKGNVSPSLKPSIEFRPNNSQGVITIPTQASAGESEKQAYNFSVKDVQNDGIQECVQQNRRNMSMDSLGKIMLRMQIHANDDSYQNTKVKMAVAAEQELKKYNTKVIQSSDPNVGRKVKVKRPPFGTNSKPPFGPLSSGAGSGVPYNKTNGLKRANNGNGESMFAGNNNLKKFKSDNPPPPRLTVHLNGKPHPNANPSAILSHSSPRDKLSSNNGTGSSNLSDHGSPESRNSSTFSNNSNCYKSSISLLHESSNLINNKKGDIVAEKEPYNSRPNSYQRISGNSSGSINSTPNSSPPPRLPVHQNGKSHPSTNPSAILSHSSPLDKLGNNSGPGSSNLSDHESPESRNSGTFSNTSSNCYKSSISLLHESSNLINSKKSDITVDKEPYSSRPNSYQRLSGNGSGSINSTPNSSPDSGISHVGNVLSSDSSINNDVDDYLSKYNKVQSNEQLVQYRNDFYAEYSEYKRLYDYVESVSRQFDELREMILSKEEESEEWHDLIRQTIEKYDEVKHKSRYNKAQKRLNYLHYKLMHIKNLINDYNRNHDKVIPNLSRFGSQLKS